MTHIKQINKLDFSGQDIYVGIDTGKKAGKFLFSLMTLNTKHLLNLQNQKLWLLTSISIFLIICVLMKLVTSVSGYTINLTKWELIALWCILLTFPLRTKKGILQ